MEWNPSNWFSSRYKYASRVIPSSVGRGLKGHCPEKIQRRVWSREPTGMEWNPWSWRLKARSKDEFGQAQVRLGGHRKDCQHSRSSSSSTMDSLRTVKMSLLFHSHSCLAWSKSIGHHHDYIHSSPSCNNIGMLKQIAAPNDHQKKPSLIKFPPQTCIPLMPN
jgi:hypothetical protein